MNNLLSPPSETNKTVEDSYVDLREHWRALRTDAGGGARELIFQHYLPYAKSIAANMYASKSREGIDFSDFSQFACVGLLESIDRFDHERNVSFKTYCTPRIRGAILSGVGKFGDAHQQISFSRRMRRDRIESLANTDSTNDQLASLATMATGLAIGFMLDGTGMYAPHHEPSSPYGNGYEAAAWQQSCLALRRAVATLPEKTEKVIRYHYFDQLPFEQIAVILGLSKGRVSQIHRAGLEELKKVLQPSLSTTFTG